MALRSAAAASASPPWPQRRGLVPVHIPEVGGLVTLCAASLQIYDPGRGDPEPLPGSGRAVENPPEHYDMYVSG